MKGILKYEVPSVRPHLYEPTCLTGYPCLPKSDPPVQPSRHTLPSYRICPDLTFLTAHFSSHLCFPTDQSRCNGFSHAFQIQHVFIEFPTIVVRSALFPHLPAPPVTAILPPTGPRVACILWYILPSVPASDCCVSSFMPPLLDPPSPSLVYLACRRLSLPSLLAVFSPSSIYLSVSGLHVCLLHENVRL